MIHLVSNIYPPSCNLCNYLSKFVTKVKSIYSASMIFKILIFGFVAYYLIRNLFGGLFKSASYQDRRQTTSNPNKKKTTNLTSKPLMKSDEIEEIDFEEIDD